MGCCGLFYGIIVRGFGNAGYSAGDATAIELREEPVKKEEVSKPEVKRKPGRPKKHEKQKEKKKTILQQQSQMSTSEEMLSLLPTECNIGVKKNAKGFLEKWIGGKLHITAVDGDIPITAIYTSASVHDSSVALVLIKETSRKIHYLYDLFDAACDADIIKEYSSRIITDLSSMSIQKTLKHSKPK